MNWKLILQLSLFGLAMGIATVFWISSTIEPFFWLVVLGISAWQLAARAGGRYFQHGVLVGLANSVWVTSAHVGFFSAYIARHPREAEMSAAMGSPRLMMALFGPVIGILSGCIIGAVAVLVARSVRPQPRSEEKPS
jgi:hypothetical protein